MLALAVILDGGSRSDAAKLAGVTLQIVRDGVLQSMRGELARRPAEADLFMPGTDPEEGKALEQKARDAHFQRWLTEKKACGDANGILEIDKRQSGGKLRSAIRHLLFPRIA